MKKTGGKARQTEAMSLGLGHSFLHEVHVVGGCWGSHSLTYRVKYESMTYHVGGGGRCALRLLPVACCWRCKRKH